MLRQSYKGVIMIGTDSPQLTPSFLLSVLEILDANPCVIGPCADGGFYLFAGTMPMPQSIWTEVIYSRPSTLEMLMEEIKQYAIPVHLLPEKSDMDTVEDLPFLLNELKSLFTMLPSQDRLFNELLRVSNGDLKQSGENK